MEEDHDQIDYISNIPPELLEIILRQIGARDLSNLRKSSKIFNKMLDNPVAWRRIFNERFKKRTNIIKFIDDNNINWREEVLRLAKLEKNVCNLGANPITRTELHEAIKSVHVTKNQVMVNGSVPLDIKSCLKKKSFNFLTTNKKYPGHLQIGDYAGQIKPDLLGGHQIINLFREETPTLHKKIFTAEQNTRLISFSSNLAILSHPNNCYSIWNLLVYCKHTDERMWKKSNKHSSCDKGCALIGYVSIPTQGFIEGICCSQINPAIVFVPSATHLQVRWPVERTSIDIEFDDVMQIQVDVPMQQSNHPIPTEQYNYFATIVGEQKVKIDGKQQHIVHCIVNKQHRFYNLKTQKLMAAVSCWNFDVWIPKTCYLAMADTSDVIVLDIQHKKVVSQFSPKFFRTFRGKEVIDNINGLHASSRSPVLIVGMNVPLICSALTGTQFELLHWRVHHNVVLTEDEKTLIQWSWNRISFWDLKNALSCLHEA